MNETKKNMMCPNDSAPTDSTSAHRTGHFAPARCTDLKSVSAITESGTAGAKAPTDPPKRT